MIVIHGKVLIGLTGCAAFGTEHCFIRAYDADTGKQVWKFNTIAQKGEPGGDTWNGLRRPVPRRRRDLDRRHL